MGIYVITMCTVPVVLGPRTICVHNRSANILKIMPEHVIADDGVCVCVCVFGQILLSWGVVMYTVH